MLTWFTLRPNGDDVVTWTRSSGSYDYQCVDEVVASDSDYIYASPNVGYAEEFTLPSYTNPSFTPVSPIILVNIRAKANISDFKYLDIRVYYGSSHVDYSTPLFTTSYVNYQEEISFDWKTNIITGIYMYPYATGVNTAYVSQIYIELKFLAKSSIFIF